MPGRRTISILFTELAASTELRTAWGEERAAEIFSDHYRDECAVVAKHAGTVVKSLGDGFMAVFDSAADAIEAVVALHQSTAVAARRAGVTLAIRVGVAAGDASQKDGDWFGTPVIEASRLCAAAPAGGAFVSDLARQLAATRTTQRLYEIGVKRLRGLKEPILVHALEAGPYETSEVAASSSVRFGIIGRLSVVRGSTPLDEVELGSKKARVLLKLLAARQGEQVAMDDIIDVLWGDAPPVKAEANVATLVSRLRAVLGATVIDGGRNGYRLVVGEGVTLDIIEAARLVTESEHRLASNQPALALTAAQTALALLASGRVLDDEPGAEWSIEANRDAERLLRRAQASGWLSHLELGDARAALTLAQSAVDRNVLDEEAHRIVMLCYHRLGEPGEALRAYERLRTTLVEELGADPGPETNALFTDILQGREANAPRPAELDVQPVAADFVGRESELASLLNEWSRATRGESGGVLITGEAGIGKTRLAAELAQQVAATGALVLRARCYEAERSLFLQPIVELVREGIATVNAEEIRAAAGERAGSLAALVRELGPITGMDALTASGEIGRRRTFEAAAEFLCGLSRRRPLLVVVDDLHEAGASTLELLHFVVRWDRRACMMIVATVRTESADAVNEQLAGTYTTLDLRGLTKESLLRLADHVGLGERAEEIMALTRGHTLFAVEALRALTDADASGPEVGINLPPSLRDAVMGRVRRCGPDVEELLRAAVVVGSAFDVAVLGELLGIAAEEVLRRAEPARRGGLILEAGDGYEFSNDLIREVIYETTPKPVRVVRHRRLVSLLVDHPEAAARHAHAAGDTRLAVASWHAAADRAAAAFANREAEQLLTMALDALGAPDDHAASSLLLARGRCRLVLGRYAPATADLFAAEQIAEAIGDEQLAASALTERAWARYYARNMAEATQLAERAASKPSAGDRAAILVGRMRNAYGDLAGACDILERVASDTSEAENRANALSCLGSALAHSDRYSEALPVLDQAVIACRQTGALRGLLNASMFVAIVQANLGRFASALVTAEQLAAEAKRFDAPYYHPRALNTLALIWRELGEAGRAQDLAEEALETSAGRDGEVEGEPAANARIALAESALMAGDAGGMERHLDAITSLLSDRVGFGWRVELRRLEIRARLDPGIAEELLTRAREFGSAKYEALALAQLGATDEATATAERTGSAWLVARVGPEPLARTHADLIAGDLTLELRRGFLERGALMRRFSTP